ARRPSARPTLVAPMFPLPMWRRSTPCRRATRSPNEIDPTRYAATAQGMPTDGSMQVDGSVEREGLEERPHRVVRGNVGDTLPVRADGLARPTVAFALDRAERHLDAVPACRVGSAGRCAHLERRRRHVRAAVTRCPACDGIRHAREVTDSAAVI